MSYTAHSTAIIDDGASIGDNTKIWHWTHISAEARIGSDCSIGQNVFIANKVVIGKNCKIQNNVSVYDNIFLDDDVFCGPSMVFTNVYNPRSHVSRKSEYRNTVVKKGVTFGANSTIVCGVVIEEYAFIAAGAVVNKNVKAFALMAGVPAKQIGWMSAYGEKLELPLTGNGKTKCKGDGSEYELRDGILIKINAK